MVSPPRLPEFYPEILNEQDQRDAFVTAVEVAVVAEFGAALDSIAGILLKDIPFFAKNHAGDEPFFFAAKQRGAQGSAESAAFPGRAIAMNDLNGDHAGLFGLAEFGKEEPASLIDSRQTSFYIESFEGGHGRTRKIVPEGRA
jgi:hypothetical protein